MLGFWGGKKKRQKKNEKEFQTPEFPQDLLYAAADICNNAIWEDALKNTPEDGLIDQHIRAYMSVAALLGHHLGAARELIGHNKELLNALVLQSANLFVDLGEEAGMLDHEHFTLRDISINIETISQKAPNVHLLSVPTKEPCMNPAITVQQIQDDIQYLFRTAIDEKISPANYIILSQQALMHAFEVAQQQASPVTLQKSGMEATFRAYQTHPLSFQEVPPIKQPRETIRLSLAGEEIAKIFSQQALLTEGENTTFSTAVSAAGILLGEELHKAAFKSEHGRDEEIGMQDGEAFLRTHYEIFQKKYGSEKCPDLGLLLAGGVRHLSNEMQYDIQANVPQSFQPQFPSVFLSYAARPLVDQVASKFNLRTAWDRTSACSIAAVQLAEKFFNRHGESPETREAAARLGMEQSLWLFRLPFLTRKDFESCMQTETKTFFDSVSQATNSLRL